MASSQTNNSRANKPSHIEENSSKQDDKAYEPERSNSEMLVKPSCECSNCHHWTTSVDWCTTPNLEFEGNRTKIHKEKKIQPLLKSPRYPGKPPKVMTYKENNCSQIGKQSAFKTLVHGVNIPHPVELVSDTYFNEDIQVSLRNLNYKHSLPIQSFVWPAIFRQLNVFMIGGRNSGKTMAYLPAICTFGFRTDHKYQELEKYKGPSAVIICPNSRQCEEIFDLIKKVYSKVHIKPKVVIITYPVTNMSNMDILITIPASLIYCLKSRIFNLKRLCHLVLEGASTLLKNNEENVYTILNVVNEMLEHRTSNTKVQLIVSSGKWTTDMSKLLKAIHMTPLVCIEDYLEAALYGGIQFNIKFLVSHQKNSHVEELLKNNYYFYKTLIICKDEEMTELNKCLVRKGIETIALRESSSKEERENSETEWNAAKGGEYKVLLCTDFILEAHLSVTDAMWVIHYSLSDTWKRFGKRFSAQLSHYKSPLNEEKTQCRSYVLIDEQCEKNMPKILNLLRRLTKDFPKLYHQYAESCKANIENEKILAKTDLCKSLKLFGKCPVPSCGERHLVSEDLDISSDLPKNGKIVFKILDIKDVTRYTVQLLRHMDLNGRVYEINNDDLKEVLTYEALSERPQDVKPGRFYIERKHTTEGPEFRFCQVVTVLNDTFVEIKLLTGLTIQVLKSSLFKTPTDLKIVEVYLCNLIPPHEDECFSGRSYHITRASLEAMEYKDIILTADVQLQLDNTLWVDNVVETAKIADSHIIKFNFTKHLLDLKVASVSKMQIPNLRKLCAKCEITLPSYAKPTTKKAAKAKEVEPQRSFLDDSPNEVIFSSAVTPEEFYVRLAKYQSLLENLEKDMQNAVKNEIVDKNVDVAVGKYYLALDPNGELYSRALILNRQNDKALCFYVDYGDEVVVDVSSIKKLPTKFITKLPFQAIQCRLHGISPAFGEWDDQATDVLYKHLHEPDSDIFRSLFVQVCDKEKAESIRTKIKYSVLLKDGYGCKNVLINQLLIDCGFASSIFGKVDDFELPKRENRRDTSDSDSEMKEDEETRKMLENLEIFDEEEFLELFCPPGLKALQNTPRLTYEKKERDDHHDVTNMPPDKTTENPPVNTSGSLTPEVFWSQTDKTVKLKIKLIGVEEYKTNIIHNRIFTFRTNLEEKTYELKFTLHKTSELGKHRAKGQEVEIILNKLEPLEWLQLTGTNKRMRNIHYEISEHEENASKRKYLQLDITDEESDGEVDAMFHEVSDLDSEFDKEAVSSSE